MASFSAGAGPGTALKGNGLVQPCCPVNAGLSSRQSLRDSEVLSSTGDVEPAR